MAPVVELLSINNPVFSAFVFYSTILIIKVLAMAPLTARQRFRKKVRNVAIASSHFVKYLLSGKVHD
jgi:uncharacterized membrane protein